MPNPLTVEPWYARADGQVYHNHTSCATGLGIPLAERLAGEGRRRLCPECKRLHGQPFPVALPLSEEARV